jgi:ABC-type polysaccharide/polyol phosphate export permease
MTRLWREVAGSRELFVELLKVQMDQRYNGSALGVIWALAVPLLTILSFSLIFSGLSGWNLADYGVYFFCGYVPWTFFQASSLHAAESLVGNAFYVTRISMPKQILPLVAVALNGIDALVGMLILFALMPLLGAPYHLSMLSLPASALLAGMAVSGMALLCAQANVFFRDFRYLLNSALFLWFFFSPVLWKPDGLSPALRPFYRLNPAVVFLELFQLPIRQGVLPPAETWLLASFWATALLLAGGMTFASNQKRFYYYL